MCLPRSQVRCVRSDRVRSISWIRAKGPTRWLLLLFALIVLWQLPLSLRASATDVPEGGRADLLNLSKQLFAAQRGRMSGQPGWLARTDFDWQIDDRGLSGGSLATRVPLYLNDTETVSWMGFSRLEVSHREKTLLNNGVAWRGVTADKDRFWELNGFHDVQLPTSHQRVGLGFRLESSAYTLKAQAYRSLTGKRLNDYGAMESASNGLDLRFESLLPHLPWAKVGTRFSVWETADAAHGHQEGHSFVRLSPLSFLTLEGSYADTSWSLPEARLDVRLRWELGREKPPEPTPLLSREAFGYEGDYTHALTAPTPRKNHFSLH